MMETWDQMKERHRQERYKLVAQFSKNTTKTEAAKELKMSLQALNNFAKRNNIYWWVIKQGQRSEKT